MADDSRDAGGTGQGPPRRGANTLPGVLQYVAGLDGGKTSIRDGLSAVLLSELVSYLTFFSLSPFSAFPVDTSAPVAPMDEDRRRFLSEALESLSSDHVKRLQQLMDTLTKPADDDDQAGVEEKEDALEELIGV